jgi:hypothetical protein
MSNEEKKVRENVSKGTIYLFNGFFDWHWLIVTGGFHSHPVTMVAPLC